MLVLAVRKEKKNFFTTFSKIFGLIKELIEINLHPLLSKKSTAKMWTILEKRFKQIFPISMIKMFLDACIVKLSDCNNVIDYISRYQIVFDKLLSLLITEL